MSISSIGKERHRAQKETLDVETARGTKLLQKDTTIPCKPKPNRARLLTSGSGFKRAVRRLPLQEAAEERCEGRGTLKAPENDALGPTRPPP